MNFLVQSSYDYFVQIGDRGVDFTAELYPQDDGTYDAHVIVTTYSVDENGLFVGKEASDKVTVFSADSPTEIWNMFENMIKEEVLNCKADPASLPMFK